MYIYIHRCGQYGGPTFAYDHLRIVEFGCRYWLLHRFSSKFSYYLGEVITYSFY
jgi:hypothetical protein